MAQVEEGPRRDAPTLDALTPAERRLVLALLAAAKAAEERRRPATLARIAGMIRPDTPRQRPRCRTG